MDNENTLLQGKMVHPAGSRLMIAGWVLDESGHRLVKNSTSIHLEPKLAQLLAYLACHANVSLSREQIIQHVWPGVVVNDEALTNAIRKLRKVFSEQCHLDSVIETIPKQGYRLLAPVERVDVAYHPRTASLRTRALAVVLLAILTGLVINWSSLTSDRQDDVVSRVIPTILVLPLRNIGDTAEMNYFIDGITDDLVTDLSRLSGMTVLTSAVMQNQEESHVDPHQVGRDVGAAYILHGSVRRSNDALRVNIQLNAVKNGAQIWANRYDRKLENIFAIQDEITRKVIDALAIRISEQEKQRLGHVPTVDFEAYDIFLKGLSYFRLRTFEGMKQAQAAYRQAIQLDPGFARAYGALAVSYAFAYRRGWTQAPNETLERALMLARKAVSIDSLVPQVHWALGYIYLIRRQHADAVSELEKAIQIAPNYADGYILLAAAHSTQGNAEKAIQYLEKGVRLNPYPTFEYQYNFGRAYYVAGKYQQALGYLRTALDMNNAADSPRFYLVACLIRRGQVEEAKWELAQLQVHNPGLTLSQLRRTRPESTKVLDVLLADLQVAGMPE